MCAVEFLGFSATLPADGEAQRADDQIDRPQLSPEGIKTWEEGMRKAAPASKDLVSAVKRTSRSFNGVARGFEHHSHPEGAHGALPSPREPS